MMKQMRENTKVILWIVVVAFVVTIFAVWGLDLQTGDGSGPGQQGIIGKVNGVTITSTHYQSVYDQIASQYRAAAPDQRLTGAQRDMIWDQAWDNIVIGILTDQQIEKMGIEVSDQEVLAYLRTSPPPEIQQYFVDEEGNFDFTAYQQALNNPEADWTGVEALARQRIPMLKLNQYLIAQVHVSAEEVTKAFEEENTKLAVDYVEFPITGEGVDAYEPSEEDLKTYYDNNHDEFRQGERAVIDYVKIPLDPTARDVEDVLYTINNLRYQISEGEDFAVLARTYSEAPTAGVDGETGFLKRSQRGEEVMTALEALKPEETSQPIQTEDGVYLVKLLETRGEGDKKEYNFREIFLRLTAGSITVDSLVTVAQDIQRRATETSLQQAVEEKGLAVTTTEPFVQGFPIPGVGFVPSISRFAFGQEPGTLSNVLGDEKNYYICRVAERLAGGTKPFESVKSQLVYRVRLDRQKRLAQRKAEGFHTKLLTSRSTFAEAAESYGYRATRLDSLTVSRGTDGIPPYSPFTYAALDLSDGNDTPPIESHGSFFVLHLSARSPFDTGAFQAVAQAIHSRLLQEKAQDYILYWYDKLKAESEIEDYRGTM